MKKESSFDAQESIEHVEVSVRTPGGTWPTEGFFIVPAAQRIVLQLEHTAKSLKLENRQGWAASVDGKRLDPTRPVTFHGDYDLFGRLRACLIGNRPRL